MERDCYECDLVSPSEGQECSVGSVCATRVSCSYWQERYNKYGQKRGNSEEYKALVTEAKTEICNKELRALCCPVSGGDIYLIILVIQISENKINCKLTYPL